MRIKNTLIFHLKRLCLITGVCIYSLHDLDIFSLNTQSSVNPESNLDNQQIRSQYFSPHSFCKFRNNLMRDKNQSRFSTFLNATASRTRWLIMDWDKNAVVCAEKSKVKIPVAKQDDAAAKRSLSV